MPKFNWIAYTESNDLKTGQIFAIKESEALQKLKNDDLKNIEIVQVDLNSSIFYRISVSDIASFFHSLFVLINSGLRLPKALEIISVNVKNRRFKDIIQDLAYQVSHGTSFYDAINLYASVFGNFTVQIIKAAQESGDIKESLSVLDQYFHMQETFIKKVKSSMIMPIFSLIFFFSGLFFIFFYLVPSLRNLNIIELNQQKNTLFLISDYLTNMNTLQTSSLFFLFLSLFFAIRTNKFKNIFKRLPFVSYFYKSHYMLIFLKFNALMLKNGVSLMHSLKLFSESLNEPFFKEINDFLVLNLETGSSLSQALKKSNFFPQDIISMVEIAQESGDMGATLDFAFEIYRSKLERQFKIISTMIQPIFLVILGLLILSLITSVYIPILEMSSSIDLN